jgi:peptidoglycan/LPS O-acetylase OafA/YrhL
MNVRLISGATALRGGLPRTAVLDQLRACAVLSVMSFHVVQMSPVPLPLLNRVTSYGQYGVDLFFVLSGWLIGGLYWRELKELASVDIVRFWKRRWLRTLPPYFVALILSWLAVHWARQERFDFGYLTFFQNYYERIPFFLVSWSLCIEEHFYLIAPFAVGGFVLAVGRQFLFLFWIVLLLISPLCRWFAWSTQNLSDFGYAVTATHLRLDGLVLGFGLSYFAIYLPGSFRKLAKWSLPFLVICILGLIAVELIGEKIQYVLMPMLIAAFFGAIVMAGVSAERSATEQSNYKASKIWYYLAVSSFSAYLVHPFVIHMARISTSRVAPQYWMLYWPTVIGMIILATALFYICVEKPSISLRDGLVPVPKRAGVFDLERISLRTPLE